jgi:hypothetical protein
MRTRPDLVVPIRDRRQHRRILTLRNFGYAVAVLIAIFAAITIEANLRGRKPAGDFGQFYGRQIHSTTAVEKKPDIVQEAPISDQNAADPMLVAPAVRSQILRDDPQPAVAQVPVLPSPLPEARPQAGSAPVIVGGPEGVALVQQGRRQPVLHGGFGR